MKFTIITHAEHKLKQDKIFAYEPYVKEMNLWLKHVDDVEIIAPISNEEISIIDIAYESNIHSSENKQIKFVKIPSFDIISFKNSIKAFLKIPSILLLIFKAMKRTDHIHLRCPGNIGLLGCLVQILLPSKSKTVKYAGNWDPKSKQPLSYRFQKWIISNSFLTKNCKVLVYGDWSNQSKNILPFFTASYSENEIEEIETRTLFDSKQNDVFKNLNLIKFLFVGGFTKGKQPLLTVKVIHELINLGYSVQLRMYGDGIEKERIENYIKEHKLEETIFLYGNQPKEIVKKSYQQSHFLVFISKSEGWPKVVAEAMFWGCVPISSNVSCIKDMLGNGIRGSIVEPIIGDIVNELQEYIENPKIYTKKGVEAMNWSRNYTLEKFEMEIEKLLFSS